MPNSAVCVCQVLTISVSAGRLNSGKRFTVIGRKADHAAGAARALTAHQRIVAVRRIRRIGHQRREIVSKDVSPFVIGIFIAGDTRIARTQEAVRIVGRQHLLRRRFLRPLPGAFCAMRRNQNPLAGKRVITAMRMIDGIKWGHNNVLNLGIPADGVTASARCPAPFRQACG
ncbi:Uncharacterised protein [Salmonella enterica subsp. enterica]|uniref:Uncharacterized protein n=1 Tax=Salmonella enterica I TaxID=59201 RepID=A0A379ULW6_SALET|nr:Uncharacterised protein [Salmonella enterica subsp. enterica]